MEGSRRSCQLLAGKGAGGFDVPGASGNESPPAGSSVKLGLWPRQWRGGTEGSGQAKHFVLEPFLLCARGNSSTLLRQPACPRRSKYSQYWVPKPTAWAFCQGCLAAPVRGNDARAWVLCPLALWPHALHTAPALGKLVLPPPWSSQPLPPSAPEAVQGMF